MRNKNNQNFVPATPKKQPATPLPLTELSVVSENKTLPNYSDRGIGFYIMHLPYIACLDITFLIVRQYFFPYTFFTFETVVYFFVILSGMWTIFYISYFTIASEVASLLETIFKWKTIDREHGKRWEYYRKINDL